MTTKSAGEPSAELLSWDSEFWGVRIARAPRLMDDWALENTIGCMWMLIPAHDQGEIHWSEARGARVMDVRVKLEQRTEGRWVNATRRATDEDTDWMVAIARTAFRGLTRFYADPRFPDDRCDDLYENWVRDSMAGWAGAVLVLENQGFITVHADEDMASIGLIAVSEKSRGAGIGTLLTNAAVNWAAASGLPRISVVTQGCNTYALRTFQRCGFRTCQTDIWLHKWFYD